MTAYGRDVNWVPEILFAFVEEFIQKVPNVAGDGNLIVNSNALSPVLFQIHTLVHTYILRKNYKTA